MSSLASILRFFLRPSPLIWGARLLRVVKPVFSWGGTTYLFRHDDVRDALERQADFGVTKVYAAKMEATTGAFFLGMEDGERYQRESAFARSAVRSGDFERIIAIVERHASEILETHGPTGRLELVQQFSRRIPLHLLDEYFGVTGPDHGETAFETLAEWMRHIFWDLFLNLNDDPRVHERAVALAGAMRDRLDELIDEARDSSTEGDVDHFLGRLVTSIGEDFDDEAKDLVRRNVGGVIVGSVDTVSKAFCLALQELMRRPEVFERARAAARAGDDETLRGYVFEALRFNPHNPILIRHASHDTVVAKGTSRERPVSAGAKLIPVLAGATFDPAAFPNPTDFDPSRSLDDSMNFGWGLHRCFGEQLVYRSVPVMMRHLLQLDGLRATRGIESAYESEGPFPDRFPLEFTPTSISDAVEPPAAKTPSTSDSTAGRV